MCSSEGGGGGRGMAAEMMTRKAVWLGFHDGCEYHTGLKEERPQRRSTLKFHASCLRVHGSVFPPCSGWNSAQWGAAVRRTFQHLDVFSSEALYTFFPLWIWTPWSCRAEAPWPLCCSGVVLCGSLIPFDSFITDWQFCMRKDNPVLSSSAASMHLKCLHLLQWKSSELLHLAGWHYSTSLCQCKQNQVWS